MHLVSPGERVVSVNDVYGGVYRMFSQVYEPKGYAFEFVTSQEMSTNLAAHLDERTRLVWIETPTNPTLNIVDIRAAAAAAHEAGALVVVDNTFATPYLQQPLELGADIVVHSLTKYLGGHSDLIGGFAATNDPTVAERLVFLQKSLGAVPGPFDCWLVLRGLKTLAVRMEKHCANARAVVEFLESHDHVQQVLYPGLASHPGHEIAAQPDARLRRHGLVPHRDRGGGSGALLEDEDLDAGREPRRRGEPHRAPRPHDARVDRRGTHRRAAQPHPALGRHRVGRRPRRGPPAGARPRVGDDSLKRLRLEPIDLLHLGGEQVVGAYVLETNDGPALFDCGPTVCIDRLKEGLAAHGLALTDVRHLLLSHIHLDHAGAAGTLVREHPTLQVHVSEIGAPHLIDPSRLDASARRLYGDAFDALWGELAPVPEENVHVVGADVVGLECFPTPGHASHHVSYLAGDGTLYAGDAAGVRIVPARHVLPVSPPPEFQYEQWLQTLDEIERRSRSGSRSSTSASPRTFPTT